MKLPDHKSDIPFRLHFLDAVKDWVERLPEESAALGQAMYKTSEMVCLSGQDITSKRLTDFANEHYEALAPQISQNLESVLTFYKASLQAKSPANKL